MTKETQQLINDAKRMDAKMKQVLQRQHTAALVERHNLRFLHVRENAIDGDELVVLPNGGMTIAYTSGHAKSRKGSVIKFSTALCNPLDTFCKREGRDRAAQAFSMGECVSIAKPSSDMEISQSRFMLETFDPMRAFATEVGLILD